MIQAKKITHTLPTHYITAAREYGHLEARVRRLIAKACLSFCSECNDICCKENICFESIESFWLKIVQIVHGHETSGYNESLGWLSSCGCALAVGRPPVCYEFFCNRILEEIPKGNYLIGLKGISSLVSFAGKNALGNRHLVALSAEEIMTLLDSNKLRKRIAKCFNLYKQYESQIESTSVPES
jgi:hypothetical protein